MTTNELYAYVENAAAFCNKVYLNGKEPDEKLMRRIEDELDIHEQGAYDFRMLVLSKTAATKLLSGSQELRQEAVQTIRQIEHLCRASAL